MKKILFVLIVCVVLQPCFSQGTLKITIGTTLKVRNGAHVVLNNMSLKNNAPIQQAANDGTFDFRGTTNDTISGSASATFGRINLSKNTGSLLTLQKNVSVVSQLIFNGGLINLDNYNIDLGTSGILSNESEASHAFTTGIGYLQATANLNAPSSANPGNLGGIVTSPADLGSTIIRRGHAAQLNVYGPYASVNRNFDILPANNKSLAATFRFQYFDAEMNGISESNLDLWKRNNAGTGWATLAYTTKDATGNYVEKKSITTFTKMTLAQGCQVIAATIPNVFAVYPGGALNTIYIGHGPTFLTLTCEGTGGITPYSYNWSNGQTTKSITVSPNIVGTYIYNVIITDAYGCQSATITKSVNVVDIRCGTKLDKVTVCVFNKGTYTTSCVISSSVFNYLANGSYLGTCGTPPATARLTTNSVPSDSIINTSQVLIKNGFDVKASPNPTSTHFKLNVESDNAKDVINIHVVDVIGTVIETRTNIFAGQTIDLGSSYKAGVYFVEIIQGHNKKQLKLIKL